MELLEYRRVSGLSLAKLAAKIGCSAPFLSLIERKKRKPGYMMTLAIVSATGGKVKAADLHPNGTGR